jgi:hypothetical protein
LYFLPLPHGHGSFLPILSGEVNVITPRYYQRRESEKARGYQTGLVASASVASAALAGRHCDSGLQNVPPRKRRRARVARGLFQAPMLATDRSLVRLSFRAVMTRTQMVHFGFGTNVLQEYIDIPSSRIC